MYSIGLLLFVLGLPLLIIYALQKKEKKNNFWLTIGIIFILFSILFFCRFFNAFTIGLEPMTTPTLYNFFI
jgi:uncharacterized membrane protein HdeD (DUF308 family)